MTRTRPTRKKGVTISKISKQSSVPIAEYVEWIKPQAGPVEIVKYEQTPRQARTEVSIKADLVLPHGLSIRHESIGLSELKLWSKNCRVMQNLNLDYRCFYVEGFADMHLGHFRLCNTIREMLGHDLYNGDVFITMSKSRDKVRLIRYENHAYTVFMKAYEHGFQFLAPKPSEGTA